MAEAKQNYNQNQIIAKTLEIKNTVNQEQFVFCKILSENYFALNTCDFGLWLQNRLVKIRVLNSSNFFN